MFDPRILWSNSSRGLNWHSSLTGYMYWLFGDHKPLRMVSAVNLLWITIEILPYLELAEQNVSLATSTPSLPNCAFLTTMGNGHPLLWAPLLDQE